VKITGKRRLSREKKIRIGGTMMDGFIVDKEGPQGLFAVFEDDGETGFLYVYDPSKEENNKIIKHVQIYNASKKLKLKEEDVIVTWSNDGDKCGVIILGGLRGIIDLKNNREGRIFMEERDKKTISDKEWLSGFNEFQK